MVLGENRSISPSLGDMLELLVRNNEEFEISVFELTGFNCLSMATLRVSITPSSNLFSIFLVRFGDVEDKN